MLENNRRANSRLNRKKKANRILNILIGIVLLLIIVVVVNIITSDETETTKEEKNTAVSEETIKEEDETDLTETAEIEEESDLSSTEENVESEDKSESNEETTEGNEETKSEENTEVITESSNDPNVENVIIDPTWAPIGTSQSGEHTSSYDKKSVDWAEKVQALAYGAGLDPSNMFVKFLGNGGSPQKSIGTVTSKDGNEIYRIYLEWIDGEGWKPTKKEILKSLENAS
ncbi:YrrS family protein [Psychrobacillus sp. FJAT-51614]|uniref:YrrS family protein n=1 Tax=Psychrobacillus mangrovi TaxID=3117745 RepID=A0ABU8F384_9BACI